MKGIVWRPSRFPRSPSSSAEACPRGYRERDPTSRSSARIFPLPSKILADTGELVVNFTSMFHGGPLLRGTELLPDAGGDAGSRRARQRLRLAFPVTISGSRFFYLGDHAYGRLKHCPLTILPFSPMHARLLHADGGRVISSDDRRDEPWRMGMLDGICMST